MTATPRFLTSLMKSDGAFLNSSNSICGMISGPRCLTISFSLANCFSNRCQLSVTRSSFPWINCRLISVNLSGKGSITRPEREGNTAEMSPSAFDCETDRVDTWRPSLGDFERRLVGFRMDFATQNMTRSFGYSDRIDRKMSCLQPSVDQVIRLTFSLYLKYNPREQKLSEIL